MDKFSQLLKAQTEVMTAQVKAAVIQSLPSLTHYTGEGSDTTDNGFDRWVEQFRERAKFADWTEAEQLYQLKFHLDKLALDVFRMLPDDERKTIDSTLAALRKRFRPADTGCRMMGRQLSNLGLASNNWDARLSQLSLEKTLIGYSRVVSIKLYSSSGSGSWAVLNLTRDSMNFWHVPECWKDMRSSLLCLH